MIAGIVRHGRSQRDSRALTAHLLKAENEPRTRILGGTLADDLPGVIRDMERLRDSTSAEAAALHIHLSPSHAMSDEELVRAAEIVRHHLGAFDHPAALVVHDKERNGGEGHSHAHLVLGRVGPSGQVLESGFEMIKLETAARIIEFELGEPATLGRHHQSAVRWLQANGCRDIAAWLEAAHGPDPDKPTSAASANSRQALARKGIDLSAVRTEIRSAWRCGGAQAVRDAGYEIAAGRKAGVWIVSRDGIEIGSLDRLTGTKRADVRSAMEAVPSQLSRKTGSSDAVQRTRKPVERVSGYTEGDPSSGNPAKFRPERSRRARLRDPLYGRKKSGAELASEAAAEQARRFAEGFRDRLDDRFAVVAARHWIEDRRAGLKGQILDRSRAPFDADNRSDIARAQRELAVLDAATMVLAENPGLAFAGEAALMGAARRHHAEQRSDNGEIRIDTQAVSDGNAALIPLGRQPDGNPASASSSLSGAENSGSSRDGGKSVGTQPPQKPVQRDSRGVMDDPSSGNHRKERSAEKATKAAWSFLGRREAELRVRIGELNLPDRFADPDELIDARRKLSDAARALADWDVRHSASLAELRKLTDRTRPMGFFAWLTGATARYDRASCELAALFDRREPFLKAASMARRSVRILDAVQETRQARHDKARLRKRDSLRRQLDLIPDARAALEADPEIALGGGKALADAARKRRAERLAMEWHRNLEQGHADLISGARM